MRNFIGNINLCFIFLIWINFVYPTKIEVQCPEFCKCDIFKNLRRASCQNKRLISLELNVPSQAQILDVSFNLIQELNNKIFVDLGLTKLKLFNASYNKISKIHLDGFEGLNELKTLDLSFNAIEYLTKKWFVSLANLQELYLRGNKLKSINIEPRITSQTLKVLDISKCGIINLHTDVFSMVPNLEVLDISENYLQNLKVVVIEPLPNLKIVKASHNNFNCQKRNLDQMRKYSRENNITYYDSCILENPTSYSNDGPVKFEKMMLAEDIETTTKGLQQKNAWLVEDIYNNSKISEISNNSCNRTDPAPRNLLNYYLEKFPWLSLTLTFLYGFFCGIFLICFANLYLQKKLARSNEGSSQISRSQSHTQMSTNYLNNSFRKIRESFISVDSFKYYDESSLMLGEFELPNTTPMQVRKQYS